MSRVSLFSPESVYRQRGFLPFLTSRLAAIFAMQIQAVVVAWQVYGITQDPLSLAYVGLAQFLPMLILLLPAGDLIDRFDRKAILGASWAVQAVCGALFYWLSSSETQWVDGYYAVLVLFGCARAFTGPALMSLLPQIVPRDRLAKAIAANGLIMGVATIGGPLLGGMLYAVGGSLAYAFCTACFIAALLLLRLVPLLFTEASRVLENTAWQRFAEGILFIRSRPIILAVISLDLFAVLLGGVVTLLPIYAKEVLHVGPEGLGALRSAMAIGALLVGCYLSLHTFNRRVGPVMFLAVAIFGVANLVFAVSSWFWLSFIALAVAGAADMFSVYIRSSLVQFSTPDAMRGRVNAVNMLFIGSSNELGDVRAGAVAAWIGAVPAAIIGGLATLAVVGGSALGFRSLRETDRFEDASPKSSVAQ